MKLSIKPVTHWFLLLLFTDLAFAFLTWVIRPGAFKNVSLFILLFTAIVLLSGLWLEHLRQRKISQVLNRFLELPNEKNKSDLLQTAGKEWGSAIDDLYQTLSSQAAQINEKTVELHAYRDYIESWVHEVKTPLFLSSLVLNNHREELSPYVYGRMNYIQHQISEHAERILYYARLQTEHVDEKFTEFRLDMCVEDVLAEYKPFTDERHIAVHRNLLPLRVVSDSKVLTFILSQLLGNAVKYADSDDGKLSVSMQQEQDRIHLAIYNNGKGIPPEDAPFIFDKGFTGNHPDRQNATGMGLYLVQKYAQRLCIQVALNPISTTGKGFEIELIFTL